jgi:hypothetical protein
MFQTMSVGNHVTSYVLVCMVFLLFIEIKIKKYKKEYFNVKTSLGTAFGGAAGERRSPNAARTKHVRQRLYPNGIWGTF